MPTPSEAPLRAMILAAGRGERMRPLTDTCPKPMLQAGGRPLIAHHLQAMADAGIRDVVINHAWLGDVIEQGLGDGANWGLRIRYSREGRALETAGGIVQAGPLLERQSQPDAPFLVVAGDVWCDWPVTQAMEVARTLAPQQLQAWCLMVDNPPHHPLGDFVLQAGRLHESAQPGGGAGGDPPRLTYSGIGVFTMRFFEGLVPGTASPLRPWLERAMRRGLVGGARHAGLWSDVGTPQRLAALRARLDGPFGQPPARLLRDGATP